MAKICWGLDIGYSAVKAVKAVRKGSTAEIVDMDAADIEPSEDEETRIDRIRAAVAEIVGRKDLTSHPVVVAIPGNQTFFREFTLPPVAESRIGEIVAYEARQQIPFPIEEVLWDYVHSGGEAGAEMGVSLIAIRRELVEGLVVMLGELGINIDAVQAAPLALFNFIRHDIDPSETALILDAGAKVTDFVVMDGKSFWFRPLPLSGEDFTRVLQQKFRMDFEQADDLKKNMGASKQAEKIFQVIEPTMRNLTGEVQRTVGYYKSLSPNAQISSVYALGNAFRLPGLVKFISGSLGVDVTYLAGLTRVGLGDDIDAENFATEFPGMGVAIGLAVQGVGLGSMEMALLPEALRVKKLVAKKKPVAVVGVAAVILAVLMSFLGAKATRDNLAGYKGDFEEVKETVETNQGEYKGKKKGLKKDEDRLRSLATTGIERGWVLDVIGKIGSVKAGGKPALGLEAGILVKQLYVSRYTPAKGMRPPEERQVSENFMGDLVDAFGKGGAGAGGGRGGGEISVEGRPVMCVLRGEVTPKAAGADGPYSADISRATAVEKALVAVKGFEKVKLGAGYRTLTRVRKKTVPGPNGQTVIVADDGTTETETVPYTLFQITWVYRPSLKPAFKDLVDFGDKKKKKTQ